MESIYKNKTYAFDVLIAVNEIPADISSDSCKAYLFRDRNGEPVITKTGDVTTSGASGIVKFEFDLTDTDIQDGRYWLQVVWTLSTAQEFVVTDEQIQVKISQG